MRVICLIALVVWSVVAFAAPVTLESPYVFTDQAAVLQVTEAPATVPYTLKTITTAGWGPATEGTATVTEGRITLTPLTEGIHILTLALDPPREVRFLALAPPPRVERRAALAALPRNGEKLFGQQKCLLLSLGDSVTSTGDYEGMLVKMLQRATGNPNITVLDKSKYGMTIDYTVRNFKEIAVANQPDIGLLMYGLNDQRTYNLEAYLEQYAWVARHLADDCAADTVLLQPTPHIAIPVTAAARTLNDNPPWYSFRALPYGASLRPLAAELRVPLAETFQAIWGQGGATLEAAAQAMWPCYPPDISKPFATLLESKGVGDTAHPNVLGELQIAKAVFQAMMGIAPPPALLTASAVTRWTEDGVVSEVTIVNTSGVERAGTITAYPQMESEVRMLTPGEYRLPPGGKCTVTVAWPQATKPEELLAFPNNIYLAPGKPLLPLVDVSGGTSRVYVAASTLEPHVERKARVATTNLVNCNWAFLDTAEQEMRFGGVEVVIPTTSAVGRLPVIEKAALGTGTGWAVGELSYVRFGAARPGEATVDGALEEWTGHGWLPVGEPCQARTVQGQDDRRATPEECYLQWAVKAGAEGIYLAAKALGTVKKDTFILYFDPRDRKELGTVGRYYWVSGKLQENGQVALSRGETSPMSPGLAGIWRATEAGITLELFVPYAVMERTAWPAAGDLGFDLWWAHAGPQGNATNLYWASDGLPWNPRWYGVLRRVEGDAEKLPYRIRVK